MTMMWPLPAQGKGLDVAARLAELTGVVEAAARNGRPAHVLEQSLWHHLLRLGHDLQAAYFALAGDGDCGPTLQLADGRGVRRLPEPHSRTYQSIFGEFRGLGINGYCWRIRFWSDCRKPWIGCAIATRHLWRGAGVKRWCCG